MSDEVFWPREAKQKQQQKLQNIKTRKPTNQLNKKTRKVIFEHVCIFCANISCLYEDLKFMTIKRLNFLKEKEKSTNVLHYSKC